jgi:hypothetical protein
MTCFGYLRYFLWHLGLGFFFYTFQFILGCLGLPLEPVGAVLKIRSDSVNGGVLGASFGQRMDAALENE